MSNPIKRVHVVFKTHLDIGFTDLAAAVKARYFRLFIPRAIDTAAELRSRGVREGFVWTTGAWLVRSYLEESAPADRRRLEEAIAAGDIAWHALPFTTHTELMDGALCDYALSLSAGLDARFGRRTIAAKLTDVPGHTVALVPHLARAGVRYLHVGVNGGSRVPDVPRIFRWRAAGGEEVLVHYDGSYGDELVLDGIEDVLVIVNGMDNMGPPSADEVLAEYRRLALRFPGAEISASTLDAFAARLLPVSSRFPAVAEEIGDTWIHGVGTDPAKVASYRELLRLRAAWVEAGRLDPASEEYRAFMGELLMVPEHTWGLDFKKYLGDYRNWSIDDFEAARARDAVDASAVPDDFRFIDDFAIQEKKHLFPGAEPPGKSYAFFEASHAEQRAYLEKARAALSPALRAEADGALSALTPRRSGDEGDAFGPGEPVTLGPWTAVFGADGSIVSLTEPEGRQLAGAGGLASYRYETFGPEDYAAWHRDYNRDLGVGSAWVYADFGKPGISYARPRPERRSFAPFLGSLRLVRGDREDLVVARLSAGAETPAGAPRSVVVRYRADRESGVLSADLDWFDKRATRLPEALWVSFCPAVATPSRWRMIKIDSPVDPMDVVSGGNRAYHAVQSVRYAGCDGSCSIDPLDSPLVSVGERRLLRFDGRFADPAGGFHFNLYNNLWGTNFPMWYGEDGRSRFRLRFGRD